MYISSLQSPTWMSRYAHMKNQIRRYEYAYALQSSVVLVHLSHFDLVLCHDFDAILDDFLV